MSDPTPNTDRWILSVDKRDLIGGAGLLVMLAGAAFIHWGAALLVAGAGLFWLALRLADR